jgi:hypothetical protein
LYLPPYYSPDPDPIEEAFSKVVKALLARWSTNPRGPDRALGRAPDAVTGRDARGCFFEHRGYRLSPQPLRRAP